MKVSTLALAFAALAASATAGSAFAANPASSAVDETVVSYDVQHAHQWSPAQSTPAGKTRAEVRQELVHAEKDGQLAALTKLYQGS